MFGSCRESIPDVQQWSGDPSGCPVVVGRLSWMSGSCREALPYVREWSGDLSSCREWWEALPNV